jgi:hypothetical protein
MSFPSEDYSGEYSYNGQDDGYPQSETNSLIQDPLLLAMGLRRELVPSDEVSSFIASLGGGDLNTSNMFSPDLVPTLGTTAPFDVQGHGNLRSGAAMMPERQRDTGTQVILFILFLS